MNSTTIGAFYGTPKYYFLMNSNLNTSGNATCNHSDGFSTLDAMGTGNHIKFQCNSCSASRYFQKYAKRKAN